MEEDEYEGEGDLMWLVVGDTEMGERVLELGSGMMMLLWSLSLRDENSPGLECL